jgi:uncharacterized membrane protein
MPSSEPEGQTSAMSHDGFGRFAERAVRALGMPWFLAGQTIVITAWVVINAIRGLPHFDPYPFIFLNLVFSALAAYAAPFILLSETRQANRDREQAETDTRHHEKLETRERALIEQNNAQTDQISRLLQETGRQANHIANLVEQTQLLLQRESEQTAMIASLSSETVEVMRGTHQLTQEIHDQVTH